MRRNLCRSLPGLKGLIATCSVQQAGLWPSVYQYTDAHTLNTSLAERKQDWLVQKFEIQWFQRLDSNLGRASFSATCSRGQKEALLTGCARMGGLLYWEVGDWKVTLCNIWKCQDFFSLAFIRATCQTTCILKWRLSVRQAYRKSSNGIVKNDKFRSTCTASLPKMSKENVLELTKRNHRK